MPESEPRTPAAPYVMTAPESAAVERAFHASVTAVPAAAEAAPAPDAQAGLLPCPCCGGRPERYDYWDGGPHHEVQCAICDLRTTYYRSEDEATAAWNRRTTPQPAGPATEPPHAFDLEGYVDE